MADGFPAGKSWPADHVERRSIGRLLPYARNARTHSDTQVAQLAKLIAAYGWTNPVLIDPDGTLIAGHGRVLAAQSLGLAEVPVMVARDWTPDQIKAYRIADNQSALQAGWDDDALKLELGELDFAGFDMELTAFRPDQLAGLLGEDAESAGGSGSGAGSLAAQFGIPPFSVLNAREGWWQDRKRAWLALGIQSELGRGDTSSTSARVGPDEVATYRTIGGRANAIPGGQ